MFEIFVIFIVIATCFVYGMVKATNTELKDIILHSINDIKYIMLVLCVVGIIIAQFVTVSMTLVDNGIIIYLSM